MRRFQVGVRQLRDRRQRRRFQALALSDMPVADPHQIVGDLRAQRLEGLVRIDRRTVAWPRNVDSEGRTERRARARVERNDAIREQQRLVDVVGDQQHRLLLAAPDFLDFVLQLGAGERVERRQRLVEQQDLRAHRQSTRHRHALAHAAGQFRRPAIERMRQADHFDVAARARGALRLAFPSEDGIDRQRHVFEHSEPRHQRIGLEHQSAIGTRAVDLGPPDRDLAGVGFNETGDERHERRLAGPGEADDGDEIAFLDGEIHVAQHLAALRPRAISLADVLKFEKGQFRLLSASVNR